MDVAVGNYFPRICIPLPLHFRTQFLPHPNPKSPTTHHRRRQRQRRLRPSLPLSNSLSLSQSTLLLVLVSEELMNREWMYRRFTSDGYISPEFQQGLESFIQFACGQPAYMDGDKIRCPCRKCKNLSYRDVDTVKLHISSKGFVFNYHVWSAQGERRIRNERPNLVGSSSSALVVVSEPDGRGKRFDKHRGGSRSAVAYSYHMGVPIKDTIYPTFKKLHYNERYDNYIGDKAIRIVDEVEAQVADLSQSLSLPEGVSPTRADTSGIFIGVAQHPVKNCVVSVGSLYSVPSVASGKVEGVG